MKRLAAGTVLLVAGAFGAGFLAHLLYLRWNPPSAEPRAHAVTYVPSPVFAPLKPAELPLLEARDVEKIRGLSGRRARIRGRVYRVGHSAKSNTYFVNFGPTRAAFTGVIFSSAVELFEKRKLPPKSLEGKEIELEGEIKDHPQYGLEMIVEDPAQLKILD